MERPRRGLTAYLHRRGITDIQGWMSQNGILSIDHLEEFCESKLLRNDIELHRVPQNTKHSPELEAHPAAALPADEGSKAEDNKEESWHVPAALRPYGKAAPQEKEESSKSKNVTVVGKGKKTSSRSRKRRKE